LKTAYFNTIPSVDGQIGTIAARKPTIQLFLTFISKEWPGRARSSPQFALNCQEFWREGGKVTQRLKYRDLS
jgi:hypothetical protein